MRRLDLRIAHWNQARTPMETVLLKVANEINDHIRVNGPDLSVSE